MANHHDDEEKPHELCRRSKSMVIMQTFESFKGRYSQKILDESLIHELIVLER